MQLKREIGSLKSTLNVVIVFHQEYKTSKQLINFNKAK